MTKDRTAQQYQPAVKVKPKPLERTETTVAEERKDQVKAGYTDRDKIVHPGEHLMDPNVERNPNDNPTPADV